MSTPATADSIGGYKIGDRVRLVKNAGAFDDASGTVIGLDVPHGWRVWVHPEGASAGVALYMDPDDLEHRVPDPAAIDARFEEQGKRIGDALARSLGVKAAPLDLTAVKAGDTVTVQHLGAPNTPMRPFEATGEVYEWGGLHVAGLSLTDPYVTLTDHQRAPEWKPGMSGTATISSCETSGSTFERHGMFFRRGDEPLSFMTDDGNRWHDRLVTDFVPDEPRALPTEDDLTEAMTVTAGSRAASVSHRDDARAILAHLQAVRA